MGGQYFAAPGLHPAINVLPLPSSPPLVYNSDVRYNPLPTSATLRNPPRATSGTVYCIAAARFTRHPISASASWPPAGNAVGGDRHPGIDTPLLVGPWLALCLRGQRVLPRGRILLLLILTGLATELIGNIGSFWALAIIGLSVEIPVVVGVTITSATLLGRIFLGERVSPRSFLALAILWSRSFCSIWGPAMPTTPSPHTHRSWPDHSGLLWQFW